MQSANQSLQADHGAGSLAARALLMFHEAHLHIEGRILRHDDEVIDGIQPKPTASNAFRVFQFEGKPQASSSPRIGFETRGHKIA